VPGLAVAALLEDAAYVELIADGNHVHPALWPLIARAKAPDRLVLISDALPLAGSAARRGRIGGLDCEVRDGRAMVAGTDTLAGSVIALDTAVRNVARDGGLPAAIAGAASNPAALLEADDRGRLVAGRRAHVVELDAVLRVRRVTRGAGWIEGAGAG
jgi:N-acetylglucosamine-6-phosphate deacetylase